MQYSVNSVTLGGGGSIAEEYIPLWINSSSAGSAGSATSPGSQFLAKGANYSSASSMVHLHTLNSNWGSTQAFALEASIHASNSSANVYVALWDFTNGVIVNGSTISTIASTFTVLRSGQFNLVPGHVYGVTVWAPTSGTTLYITKAHLVALSPQ